MENNNNFINENEFVVDNGVLINYNGNSEEVIIPQNVLVIGENAFNYSKVKKVVLSDSVVEIENYAFTYSDKLEEIIFSKNIKKIGDNAFYCCSLLDNVILPPCIEAINKGTFYSCKSIKSIEIPSSVKVIEKDAFFNCFSLKMIVLNEGLEEIKQNAFMQSGIEKIEIPASVKEIERGAFYETQIKYFSVSHENKSFIEKEGCLLNITGEVLYEGTVCGNVPDGVKIISSGAFYGRNVKSVVLPQGVVKIEKSAFCMCELLESVSLPYSLKEIEDEAFYCCFSLKVLSIPKTINYVGSLAFGFWQKEQSIIFENNRRATKNWNCHWKKKCKAKRLYPRKIFF